MIFLLAVLAIIGWLVAAVAISILSGRVIRHGGHSKDCEWCRPELEDGE